MPGPVSDSYDPEFGTGENADLVAAAVKRIADLITNRLGERKPIVDVVRGPEGEPSMRVIFTERDLRVIRFGLERALESL